MGLFDSKPMALVTGLPQQGQVGRQPWQTAPWLAQPQQLQQRQATHKPAQQEGPLPSGDMCRCDRELPAQEAALLLLERAQTRAELALLHRPDGVYKRRSAGRIR